MTLILSGTDGLSDVDGTAATPAIRGTDANTGIFFPAADTIAFSEGGVEAMRIDSSGNVGIGTASPQTKLDVSSGSLRINEDGAGTKIITVRSNFAGVGPAINVTTNDPLLLMTNNTERARIDSSGNLGLGVTPSASTIVQFEGGSNLLLVGRGNAYLSNNATFNSGFKYISTAAAGQYNISGAQHSWFNAASGTAGNAITFTQAMTLDASGRLGVGQTSPSAKLDILSTSGTTAIFKDSARYALVSIQSSGTNQDTYLDFAPTGTGSAVFQVSSVERARIDSSGNFGIGANISGLYKLEVNGNIVARRTTDSNPHFFSMSNSSSVCFLESINGLAASFLPINFKQTHTGTSQTPMILDASGNLLVGTTTVSVSSSINGFVASSTGDIQAYASGRTVAYFNRNTNDGTIVSLRQADTEEGSISVSGTTVSYNGGHLSRWAQTTAAKDDSLVKGTVLSNLDAMNVYTDAEGNPVDNEQLNKVKVSDVEGDANVAGVFVNWTHDEAHDVDEINMAMTGDMIIRIAQGVTVQRGDLLMSAGNGTAKPQGDDIVRSKTVAKVTSTHVTCTYADGSYCVPCVLMAC